ncbi:hypothetical protein [Shewanella baltica]|uniref:hypothetical protein n=1 Tax=Shewanella baltica TaxID=62322 RepID=UPI00217D1AD0|nr:hypothetical protein [Shewanella baltica]MCS6192171.1 hypothetical protein [Shewanella baltica]
MRAAIVIDGIITNIILAKTLDLYPSAKLLSDFSMLKIGDEYDELLANIDAPILEPESDIHVLEPNI